MIFILKLAFISLIYIIPDAESQVLHYGDHIEFYSALKYCPDPNTVFNDQIRKFGYCLQAFSKSDISQPKEISVLCTNKLKYESCWGPVIRKSRECNAASGQGTIPKNYMGVIQAVCRNDNGHGYIERLKKEIKHIKQNGAGEPDCEQTEHWQNACKQWENEMNSHDICIRHVAYYSCLNSIKCNELSRGEWSLSIYHYAGYTLGCKYDDLNEVEHTLRDKRLPWNQQVNHYWRNYM